MMPALFLKKMVMGNFDKSLTDPEIADSIDFLVEKVTQNIKGIFLQPSRNLEE